MQWPSYIAGKPLLRSCISGVGIAAASFGGAASLAALLYGIDVLFPTGGGAGWSLIAGFVIGPIVVLAGLPWSITALVYDHSAFLTLAIMAGSVLLNGLLAGFVVGLVKLKWPRRGS